MGFIFLLLQHFYTTTAADLWLSTYLTGLTVERYLSVACHQWHNKHVTQRKLTCVAIAVAASFCCCVAISDFILTETPNQSGKVKELVTSLIISLCGLLVLITQCAVCCHVRAFRKTHPHPTGLKVIVYTITFKDNVPPPPPAAPQGQGLLSQGHPPSKSFVTISSRTHFEDCGNKSFFKKKHFNLIKLTFSKRTELSEWFRQRKFRKNLSASLPFSLALMVPALFIFAVRLAKIFSLATCWSKRCPIEWIEAFEILDDVSWLIPFYQSAIFFLLDSDFKKAFNSRFMDSLNLSASK